MAITPWYVGQLSPAWVISLVPDKGVVNISGLVTGNFSLLIRNIGTATGAGSETSGLGTFSAITAAVTTMVDDELQIISHASVQYQLASADVVVASKYHLFVIVNFVNGPEPFDLGTWEVL